MIATAPSPELLAPAGDWDCVRAAVENGADAIYFGLDRFNARMRARNFTEADLPPLMEFLHRRGVKGYAAFNTLVFANELDEAEQHLKSLIGAGVDAAIVQDIGIGRLIRRLSPDFPIHASTQMTVTSAAGVEFARELGCRVVVLARECSLREIGQIQHLIRSDDARGSGFRAATMSLEVFVHGALCVAYSGQCLTSEALGGRSANRGECAQACRMPYQLTCDGRPVDLGDRRYLLSPQDLAGLEVLPDLVRLGVASLKIEGRLKSPEYVANVTRIYRRALDELAEVAHEPALAGPRALRARSPGNGTEQGCDRGPVAVRRLCQETRYDLEMAFSRGLSTGWFRGINNQRLVHARFGKKRGVYLGTVRAVQRGQIAIDLQGPLKPGDGVVFDAGRPDEPEEGGRVYAIERCGGGKRVSFAHDAIQWRRVHAGDRLWKTSDPELDGRLRRSFSRPRFQRPVQIELEGSAGAPLAAVARDELGRQAITVSAMPLEPAENQPLTPKRLEQHFGRMGGTPFRLEGLETRLEGALMLPLSELNRMRRELVRQLEERRRQAGRWTIGAPAAGAESCWRSMLGPAPSATDATRESAALVVLVRNLPQLEAALDSGIATVYCEFEDPKRYREAVRIARARPAPAPEIWLAPPRVFKPGEEWILRQVRSAEPDGYLVRNYDHLSFFGDGRRIGDFSLNVANPLTAEYFIRRYGLERVTASYDLNPGQLEALLRSAPPAWFEITVHQHMPMFHMEHCVFCAFLSRGTDYTNCGRPCDRHVVKLVDRVGAPHPLKADAGCRNTVFNAVAQTGAEHLGRMQALGARRFRLEFLLEPPEMVRDTVARYRSVLAGQTNGAQLWRELKLLNQLGVTRGTR